MIDTIITQISDGFHKLQLDISLIFAIHIIIKPIIVIKRANGIRL